MEGKGWEEEKDEERGCEGTKEMGLQGLVHTPMSEILKDILIAELM